MTGWPHPSPGKAMEHILLEASSSHVSDRWVFRISQHRFARSKSYLTNLIAFYNKRTRKERWMLI